MTRKEAKIYVAERLLKQGELSAHEQAEHFGLYDIAYRAGLMNEEIKFCFASLLLKQGQQSPYALAASYGIPLATATNILEELVRDGVARKHVDGTEYRGGNERPNIRYTPTSIAVLWLRDAILFWRKVQTARGVSA